MFKWLRNWRKERLERDLRVVELDIRHTKERAGTFTQAYQKQIADCYEGRSFNWYLIPWGLRNLLGELVDLQERRHEIQRKLVLLGYPLPLDDRSCCDWGDLFCEHDIARRERESKERRIH